MVWTAISKVSRRKAATQVRKQGINRYIGRLRGIPPLSRANGMDVETRWNMIMLKAIFSPKAIVPGKG